MGERPSTTTGEEAEAAGEPERRQAASSHVEKEPSLSNYNERDSVLRNATPPYVDPPPQVKSRNCLTFSHGQRGEGNHPGVLNARLFIPLSPQRIRFNDTPTSRSPGGREARERFAIPCSAAS